MDYIRNADGTPNNRELIYFLGKDKNNRLVVMEFKTVNINDGAMLECELYHYKDFEELEEKQKITKSPNNANFNDSEEVRMLLINYIASTEFESAATEVATPEFNIEKRYCYRDCVVYMFLLDNGDLIQSKQFQKPFCESKNNNIYVPFLKNKKVLGFVEIH